MCNGRTCGGAGRGECTDGGCRCHPRWSGAGCCEPEEICPDDYLCYHGVCNERGHCDCDLGYTGDDCSLGPFFVGNEDDCEEEEEEKKSGKSGKRTCAARRAAAAAAAAAAASFIEVEAGPPALLEGPPALLEGSVWKRPRRGRALQPFGREQSST